MGVVAILGLAVSAASTIVQAVQGRKAAKARRESQAVQTAGEAIRDRLARRRAAREERVRRARLLQSSEVGGTSGSSGELGASGALRTNSAAGVANQSSQRTVSQGISAANQQAADAQSRAASVGAFADLVQSGLNVWDEARQQRN